MGVLETFEGEVSSELFAFEDRGEEVPLPLLQQWDPARDIDPTAGQVLELCFQQFHLGARIIETRRFYRSGLLQ